mgnify:CR=1 FL=1
MGGNYGGDSIPTIPLSAVVLINSPQVYKNFICSGVFGGNNFVYEGTTFVTPSDGTLLKMRIAPNGITAANGDVKFLCYDCSCHSPYSGITTDSFVNYSGTTARFRPVIIGGGGLNS